MYATQTPSPLFITRIRHHLAAARYHEKAAESHRKAAALFIYEDYHEANQHASSAQSYSHISEEFCELAMR